MACPIKKSCPTHLHRTAPRETKSIFFQRLHTETARPRPRPLPSSCIHHTCLYLPGQPLTAFLWYEILLHNHYVTPNVLHQPSCTTAGARGTRQVGSRPPHQPTQPHSSPYHCSTHRPMRLIAGNTSIAQVLQDQLHGMRVAACQHNMRITSCIRVSEVNDAKSSHCLPPPSPPPSKPRGPAWPATLKSGHNPQKLRSNKTANQTKGMHGARCTPQAATRL